MSLRQIARKHGIAESNLRAKALRCAWGRNDGEAVRIATKTALAEAATARAREIGAKIGAEQAQKFEVALEQAVRTTVQVVSEHQAVAGRGLGVAMGLLCELEMVAANPDAIDSALEALRGIDPSRAGLIERAVSLRSRVETLDKWAAAVSKIIAAERDAHGMNDNDQGKSSVDEMLIRLAEERRRRVS